MFYDVRNQDDRTKLTSIILQGIEDDEGAQSDDIREEWDTADNYYENDQTPEGFEENFAQAFSRANDPQSQKKGAKMYVTINKVLTGHEGVIGDFITAARQIMVKGRSPKDMKFAKVWKKELEYVQDSNRMWETAIFPCLDTGIRRGLHWLKVSFDPFQNLPWGKIIVEEISCREVLVDKNSRGTFYQDKRRLTHRKRYAVEEANEYFGDMLDEIFEGGKQFSRDTDYAIGSQRGADDTRDLFCTVYEQEYTQKESRYFELNESAPDDEMLQPILDEAGAPDRQTYQAMRKGGKKVIRIVDDVFYKALFNRSTGAFSNAESDLAMWSMVPFINIKSERRLYPLGSAKYDKNLQDLLNVVASLIVKHGGRSTDGIIAQSVEAFRQFTDQTNEALKNPGKHAIPGVTGVFYPHQLGDTLPLLFQLVAGTLEDVQSQHGLSKGEMPKERLAKETVQLLLTQDRKSHGRKEVMTKWTLTELANVLLKVIQTKWTEEHWARTMDVSKGEDQYTPINMQLHQEEYAQLLMELSGIPNIPNPTAQQQKQIDIALQNFKMQFEQENEVRVSQLNLFEVRVDGQVKQFTDEQLQEFQESTGLEQEAFVAQYQPAPLTLNTYSINDITEDPNVDVVMDIDFNAERDKELRYNKATMAVQMRAITPLRWLKNIDYEDAEAAWAEAKKHNEIVQIGEKIVGDPKLYQRVMQILTSMATKEASGSNGNGSTSTKAKPQKKEA